MSKLLRVFAFFIVTMGFLMPEPLIAAADAGADAATTLDFTYGGIGFRRARVADARNLHNAGFGHPAVMEWVEYSLAHDAAGRSASFGGEWAKDPSRWTAHVAAKVVEHARAGDLDAGLQKAISDAMATDGKSFDDADAVEWVTTHFDIVDGKLEEARGNFFARRNEQDLDGEEKEAKEQFHAMLTQVSEGVFVYPYSRTLSRVTAWADKHAAGNPFSLWIACNVERPDEIYGAAAYSRPGEDNIISDTFWWTTPSAWGEKDDEGRSIGARMVQGTLSYLYTHGDARFTGVISTVRSDNEHGKTFHEGLGFKEVKEEARLGSPRTFYHLEIDAENVEAWAKTLETVSKPSEGGAAAAATDDKDE
jgi:hypothetical protein